jgi:hypothetical protein
MLNITLLLTLSFILCSAKIDVCVYVCVCVCV